MDVAGKVTVVTGAGSGIGRALALAFAAADAAVVVADIDHERALETVDLIAAAGGRAIGHQCDASANAGIAASLAVAAEEFGPVDIYVANAGIGGEPGLVIPERDWDRVLDVNLRAHIRAATQLVPVWVDRGGGYFVIVASAAGLLTQIGSAAYSVSKHAVVGFAEWLAIAYGDLGVGVSCVCPMGVNTPLLNELRDSPEPAARLAADAVIKSGAVVEPAEVAAMTLDAVRAEQFLVLPHPQVLDMYRRKGADYDGWIAGMRRYQRRLSSDG